MKKNWIQSVDKEMEKKGTVGAFTKQAKKAGMSVHDFAEEVKKNPEEHSALTRKRANLALTFERIAKKRKSKDTVKMSKGGSTGCSSCGKSKCMCKYKKGGAIYEGDKVRISGGKKSMKVEDISKNKKGQVEFSGRKNSRIQR